MKTSVKITCQRFTYILEKTTTQHGIQEKGKMNHINDTGITLWLVFESCGEKRRKRSLQLPEAGFLLLWKSGVLLWSPERDNSLWVRLDSLDRVLQAVRFYFKLRSAYVKLCIAQPCNFPLCVLKIKARKQGICIQLEQYFLIKQQWTENNFNKSVTYVRSGWHSDY